MMGRPDATSSRRALCCKIVCILLVSVVNLLWKGDGNFNQNQNNIFSRVYSVVSHMINAMFPAPAYLVCFAASFLTIQSYLMCASVTRVLTFSSTLCIATRPLKRWVSMLLLLIILRASFIDRQPLQFTAFKSDFHFLQCILKK